MFLSRGRGGGRDCGPGKAGTVSKIQRDLWVDGETGALTGASMRWINLIIISILCYAMCRGQPGGLTPWWAPSEEEMLGTQKKNE